MTCPACGDGQLDATPGGPDLCTSCGALSRDGVALGRDAAFASLAQPVPVDVAVLLAHGVIVQALVLDDGVPAIGVTVVLHDGHRMHPIVFAGDVGDRLAGLVVDAHLCVRRYQERSGR